MKTMTMAERLRALLRTAKLALPLGVTTSRDAHWLREVRDAAGLGIAWCGDADEALAHAQVRAIVAAVNALPALLDVVEAVQAVVDDGEPSERVHLKWLTLRDALSDLESAP